MKRFILFIMPALLALGACTSAQTNDAFVAAETSDAAALAALISYEQLPSKNEAVIQKLLVDQQQFDVAAAPAEAQVAAGQLVTNVSALTGAVAVLMADETANGLSVTQAGSK